jgi:hypothetical protein
MDDGEILTLGSATTFKAQHRDKVVICGSHGGVYPAYLAAKAGLRAILLNDAGGGLEEAGRGSLAYADARGMAAATVAHDSARIGDGEDMAARGRLSGVNRIAAGLGCEVGMAAAEAARLMLAAAAPAGEVPAYREARMVVMEKNGGPAVVALDSISLVIPVDEGQIVLTGSHGGLPGTDPALAVAVDVLAAIYNDAGIGIDDAGTTRLPALEGRGIAGAVVDCMTARIGDGLSTYETGILTRLNPTAERLGGRPGMTAGDFVERIRQKAG